MKQTMLTSDDQAALLRWAGKLLRIETWQADSQAMGVLDAETKEILAVGVLNCFHDQGAWIHIAAQPGMRWATPHNLASMFYIPFVYFGLHRVTGRVTADDRRAQALNMRLGFVLEGREREAQDGQDVLIFGMLARECPWLDKED